VQVGGERSDLASQVRQLSAQGIHTYGDLAALSRLLEQARAYGSDLAIAQDTVRKAYAYYVKIALLPEGLSLNNEEILPVLIARDGLLRYDLLTEITPGEYPTLILHGERDRVISSDLLHTLRQQLGAELKEIPEAGHYIYLDSPDTTLAEIVSFLEAHLR
jgi:pimeloyl-ACP methyl ester carboxylesterase